MPPLQKPVSFWFVLIIGTAIAWWLFSVLGGVSRAAQLGQWELASQIFLTRAAPLRMRFSCQLSRCPSARSSARCRWP